MSHSLSKLQSDTLNMAWPVGNNSGVAGHAFLRLRSLGSTSQSTAVSVPGNTLQIPLAHAHSLAVFPTTYSPILEIIGEGIIIDTHQFTLTVLPSLLLTHGFIQVIPPAGFSLLNIPIGIETNMQFPIFNFGAASGVVSVISEVSKDGLTVQQRAKTTIVPAGEPDDAGIAVVQDVFIPTVVGNYLWRILNSSFDLEPTPKPFTVA